MGLGNPFCNFTEVILMNAKNHDIEGKYANNSLLCVMFSVKGKVVSSMEFCLWLLEETSASAAPTERPTWLFQAGRKNDFTRFYKILYQRRWGGRLTGRAELCKLATFQKNTLLSVAVSTVLFRNGFCASHGSMFLQVVLHCSSGNSCECDCE